MVMLTREHVVVIGNVQEKVVVMEGGQVVKKVDGVMGNKRLNDSKRSSHEALLLFTMESAITMKGRRGRKEGGGEEGGRRKIEITGGKPKEIGDGEEAKEKGEG